MMRWSAVPLRCCAALALCALLGCSATEEIRTSPPKPRAGTPDDEQGGRGEAPLSIVMTRGPTTLPEEVSALRFRITEIQLRRSSGEWIRLPSDAGPLDLNDEPRAVRRTLVDTRVTPGTYDSLAVSFSDVFVRFGENAGAPLTAGDASAPHRLAVEMRPSLDTRTTVVLALEPKASLTRSPDCRWFFVPMIRPEIVSSRLP